MHFSCVMRHYRLAVIVIYNDPQTIIMDLLLNNALAATMALASTNNFVLFFFVFDPRVYVQRLHDSIVVFRLFQISM